MALAERDVLYEENQQPGIEAEETVAALEKGRRGRKPAAAAASAPDPVAAPAVAVAPAAKRKFRIPGYVYWLGLVVVVLIGGFWLVQNSWVIADNIDHPYALLAGPTLVASGLALWLIIKFFAAIERGIRSAWAAFREARKRDEAAQFFWMVIIVFLAVSVFASGDFFSKLEREAVPGLGYATALFIDLVAVQCMRARLNAGRLRNRRGQALYLLGVLICASASAFANVYTTLSTFDPQTSGLLPAWMAIIAPWFGLVFPLLIVLLSMTADYTLDQTSSKLDPEIYKKEESKRVKLLEYQRDLLRERVNIEQELDDLAAQLRGRKERRMFFLVAWLFPLQLSGKQLLKRVEALYQPQLVALTQQNEALRVSLAELDANARAAYAALAQAVQSLTQSVWSIDSQRDTDNGLIVERVEGLVASLRQELASTLRQEMRALPPTKLRINYTELARVLAPLVVKQGGLGEVDSVVENEAAGGEAARIAGDTEELSILNLEHLTSLNSVEEARGNEVNSELQEGEREALLKLPTVSVKDAARLIGCESKYVRTLRDRRKLKATPRNSDLITTASLKNYLAERAEKVS